MTSRVSHVTLRGNRVTCHVIQRVNHVRCRGDDVTLGVNHDLRVIVRPIYNFNVYNFVMKVGTHDLVSNRLAIRNTQ